jgi:fimbrial chaperone protein
MRRAQFQRAVRRLAGRLLPRAAVLLGAGLIAFVPARFADAAALQVSPIRLDLSADRPAAALTLHNDGTTPINAQVRVFGWSQALDEDRLERSDRVVASPPIVQIAPGADQTVRILRVGNTPVTEEETYRLLIDEIPNDQTAQTTGVRVQLRYSVPVFVGAPEGKPPVVDFALEHTVPSASAAPGAALMLRAANHATGHAQLSQVRLEWPNGQSTQVSSGLLGYALPHATRRWPVAGAPAGAASATLHAVVNGEAFTTRIAVEPASGAAVSAVPAR